MAVIDGDHDGDDGEHARHRRHDDLTSSPRGRQFRKAQSDAARREPVRDKQLHAEVIPRNDMGPDRPPFSSWSAAVAVP
jgi:hypothetical protein